jgi:hypothetical protein
MLVADGTYSGTLPTLSASGNVLAQNILFAAASEAYDGGYASTVPTVAYMTETLGT